MVEGFDGTHVLMSDGGKLGADMVVLGIGVRPNVVLARDAGLDVDNGVIVDAHMQTSKPGIFAAGDIARYPDASSGEWLRIEHWVVAERQGQVAARNILGEDVGYRSVPFFWSNHYDLAIRYIGHAAKWDRIEVAGSVANDDCTVRYILDNRIIAAASIGRDRENLELERALEKGTPSCGHGNAPPRFELSQ
jgi:3-phenylpropionate/trans-cinnamate dioxygenase ferredoxin reductase subunit